MKKTVFISRKPTECEAIKAYLPANVEIVAQSLIETVPIPFERNIPKTDWIFFSSSNAARHFFEQQPMLSNQKIGAIGDATAKTIQEYHSVDFVGNATNITDSAYRFAETIETSSVLFPGASESLRHIQSALPAEQVVELTVYSTTEKNTDIPSCDIYVFQAQVTSAPFLETDNTPWSTSVLPSVIQPGPNC